MPNWRRNICGSRVIAVRVELKNLEYLADVLETNTPPSLQRGNRTISRPLGCTMFLCLRIDVRHRPFFYDEYFYICAPCIAEG